MQLVFDIETNGLLNDVNTLHVCCTYDIDTKETWYSTNPKAILAHLSKATHLIGHNIIDYDLAVLEKLYNWKPSDDTRITDTLVLSRLGNPDRKVPIAMARAGLRYGPHSLAAWGYRVGRGKPEHEDWTVYSEAMLHRCQEDVLINVEVYHKLVEELKDFGESRDIEHEVQRIISAQERAGVYFDRDKAERYIEQLRSKIHEIDERLQPRLPRHARGVGVEIKKPFKKDGSLSKAVMDWLISILPDDWPGHCITILMDEISGPFTRIEWVSVDLNSVKQVKEWLESIGWVPDDWNYNAQGERTSPKITESSLESLGTDEAGALYKERHILKHRLGVIEGWVEKVREDGTIQAGANPCGTPTGRMKHRVVVNCPAASVYPDTYEVDGVEVVHPKAGQLWYYEDGDQPVPFGTEMRSLFTHRPGRKIVGHDASGLELRMLAHYMNDPQFTEQVLHGDIHSYNQRLAGLPTRNAAKTFIYAFIYGAGNAKLGSIIDGTANDGAKLRDRFLSNLPKLRELIDKARDKAKRGYLIGLDGRKMFLRRNDNGDIKDHTALNLLLQGAGAIVMKKSMVLLDERSRNLDRIKVIDMHDEGQADVSLEDAELYAELAVQSIRDAGKHFNLNIPLDAEAKIGDNWAETH